MFEYYCGLLIYCVGTMTFVVFGCCMCYYMPLVFKEFYDNYKKIHIRNDETHKYWVESHKIEIEMKKNSLNQ